jgi:ferredoxin
MNLKLHLDREVCAGAGICVLTAPKLFDQDDELGLVVLLEQPDEETAEAARHAVEQCPSGAIALVEDAPDEADENASGGTDG